MTNTFLLKPGVMSGKVDALKQGKDLQFSASDTDLLGKEAYLYGPLVVYEGGRVVTRGRPSYSRLGMR